MYPSHFLSTLVLAFFTPPTAEKTSCVLNNCDEEEEYREKACKIDRGPVQNTFTSEEKVRQHDAFFIERKM